MSLPDSILKSVTSFKDYTSADLDIIKVQPHGNSTFSANGTTEIVFRLPTGEEAGLVVGEKSIKYLEARADGDSASDDQFMNHIGTIFDRQVVKIGNTEILREDEWGWFRSLEFDAKASSSDRASVSSTIMGVPAQSHSGTFKKYGLPLASKWDNAGFFKDPIPLFNCSQVELKYYVNRDIAEYTTATTAVTSVNLQNIELELYVIRSPALMKLYKSVDVVRSFDTYKWWQGKLQSGTTRMNFSIPFKAKNLKAIFMVMRDSADPIDPNWATGTSLNTLKYSNAFQLNGIDTFQVKINGKAVLDQPMKLNDYTELVPHLTRAWGLDRLGDWHDSIDATDGKNYIGLTFAPFTEGVSGRNLEKTDGNIVVEAGFSSGISANTDVDFFLVYSKFVKWGKDGSVSVFE